ncbi:MAG: SDR family oxidoreductase [Armatimonadota bacterium]|nr:SDR family oxidoreductase [Armatimonadota bacterium]MDR7422040.1 SDR family oxidoreductase [Armatimonadota bacterium]MDR7455442.1 SDR family oxidoreductase [Armatimonadota bacterium]MDR7498069.1 SDR family oxidoreductase [Armatimonadota bacterium]MDR7513114.1 SDR family oxidoreductase [Armatimonadota bacterium]
MDYERLFRLDGRAAVVVGAASGIGAAAARGLAAHGAVVLCADKDTDGARATADAIVRAGQAADAVPVDITDPASVTALIDTVLVRLRALDILVVTPSINVRKPLLRYTDDEFDRVVGLNLKGSFRVLRAAGEVMARQGRGSIIVLSSIRSQVVEPGQGVYAATKAGLVQMARALAAELAPLGVRVNAVAPGVVETPLTQPIKAQADWYEAYARRSALGRWATPDELVGPVVFLASDASSYVTGAVLFVDGGWTAVDGRYTPPL